MTDLLLFAAIFAVAGVVIWKRRAIPEDDETARLRAIASLENTDKPTAKEPAPSIFSSKDEPEAGR